jgi:ankyrin repeat protein
MSHLTNGFEPIIWREVRKDHVEYVQRYLNKGGDPNLARTIEHWKTGWPEKRFTLLMEAARGGSLDTASLLLENGANPNAETSHYHTALLFASANGNLKMVELLVKNGANINYSAWNTIEEFAPSSVIEGSEYQPCTDTHDALCEAMSNTHVDVVHFLINNGFKIQKGHLESAKSGLEWSRYDFKKQDFSDEDNERTKKYEAIINLIQNRL